MKQLSVRGTLSEEAERSSRSSGVLTWGWRAGRIRRKSITKTDDHFDLPPIILPSSSRSAWLSGHVSRNAEM